MKALLGQNNVSIIKENKTNAILHFFSCIFFISSAVYFSFLQLYIIHFFSCILFISSAVYFYKYVLWHPWPPWLQRTKLTGDWATIKYVLTSGEGGELLDVTLAPNIRGGKGVTGCHSCSSVQNLSLFHWVIFHGNLVTKFIWFVS